MGSLAPREGGCGAGGCGAARELAWEPRRAQARTAVLRTLVVKNLPWLGAGSSTLPELLSTAICVTIPATGSHMSKPNDNFTAFSAYSANAMVRAQSELWFQRSGRTPERRWGQMCVAALASGADRYVCAGGNSWWYAPGSTAENT